MLGKIGLKFVQKKYFTGISQITNQGLLGILG